MPSSDELVTEAQKLKALRQIQYVLGHTERPLARACGLTEDELPALANEEMIEVTFSSDDGPDLDRYHVERILPKGFAILAKAHVLDSPVRVAIEHRQESGWLRLRRALVSGLWDVIKIALGVPVGILVGWFLWKHHWK